MLKPPRAPPCESFRVPGGLSLRITIDNDCDDHGEWAPAAIATLHAARHMVAFCKALLRDCRAGQIEGASTIDDPSIWIGRCSFDLVSTAEAERAAKWLRRQAVELGA
jgi:hypothetical protein